VLSLRVRLRGIELIEELRGFRATDGLIGLRARLTTADFWRPIGASVLLHAAAFAGLVALHRADHRSSEPPAIQVALTPSDPDARVGPQTGIAWQSAAERSALVDLLESRRSAALMDELVIRPNPRPTPRPSPPRRAPPPPPATAMPSEQPVRPAPPPAPAVALVAELPVPPAAPPHANAARPAEPVRRPPPSPEPTPVPAPRSPARAADDARAQHAADAPGVPVPVGRPAETASAPAAATRQVTPPVERPDQGYLDAVFERLRRYKDYPELAKYHTSGRVLVAFTVGRDGTVLSAEVRRSSGYGFIDRAGLDLIRRASPLPALPGTMGQDSFAIEVPISFSYD
jgi:protein TonB